MKKSLQFLWTFFYFCNIINNFYLNAIKRRTYFDAILFVDRMW